MTVYSVHAQEDGQARLKEVRDLLVALDVQMQKFDSIQRWHYGNVGDLGHLAELLNETLEFAVSAD